MTEWEYQEMKQAFREQRERFKDRPEEIREYLNSLGIGNLFPAKEASQKNNREIAYPCTSEYLPVDLSVFLCD